ncbi:MAG: hypothetical protein HC815_05595 [Richelia sp. RM1_1_1]|nr:hypothetical protein [Richelia sp. RM1_1_1]
MALERVDNDNFDAIAIKGLDILSWFIKDNKPIESLVCIYQSNLASLLRELVSAKGENFAYDIYLKLLRKELNIPNYQILRITDIAVRLLRKRYLESLGINNIGYFNLYNLFMCKRDNLFMN